MFIKSPLAMALREMSQATVREEKAKVLLDGAVESEAPGGAASYADADLRLKSAAVVHQWAETSADDLADGENLADRLLALVVGVADADKDGEISDEEADVCEAVLGNVWEYLLDKGASEEDCSALLNEFEPAAADRVHDLIVSALPDGEDESSTDIDAFAFDSDSDSAVFDAVYKKALVVRAGRKVRINKRVSGKVRLSAKQKIAVKKMLRKSHSAVATIRRMRSNRIRKKAGL